MPEAHTYFVLDHEGICVGEFDTWEKAAQCYLEQSPCELIGAWLLFGLKAVPALDLN